MAMDAGAFPAGIIEFRPFESDLRRRSIVAFQKLGLVSGNSGRDKAGVFPAADALIRARNQFSIRQKIENHSVPAVAADPYAIDESLIIGVYRQCIDSGMDKAGDVDFIVKIVKRVSCRRPLPDSDTVDIELVIIVA